MLRFQRLRIVIPALAALVAIAPGMATAQRAGTTPIDSIVALVNH